MGFEIWPKYHEYGLVVNMNMTPEKAFFYACDLEHRFEKGEPIIAQDPGWSFWYAKDILKGRFELGEDVIAQDPNWAFDYAREILRGRFEQGEPIIATNVNLSYRYAVEVTNERFELAEPSILESPYAESYRREFDFDAIFNLNLNFREMFVDVEKLSYRSIESDWSQYGF